MATRNSNSPLKTVCLLHRPPLTIPVPWAEAGARFTLLFERLAMAWLQEPTPTAASRCRGMQGVGSWNAPCTAIAMDRWEPQRKPVRKHAPDTDAGMVRGWCWWAMRSRLEPIKKLTRVSRPMIFVDDGGHTDAHLNLALEEHRLRHKMAGDDLLLFYVNSPAIIIGGNLNFSFMTRDVSGRFNRYEKFNGALVEVLRELGVPAVISGRNDILADGRKISGDA